MAHELSPFGVRQSTTDADPVSRTTCPSSAPNTQPVNVINQRDSKHQKAKYSEQDP
jgi:hypothetical protein